MKNIVLSFILIILSKIMFAQNILTIENEDISLDEFKGIFYKNNVSSDITKEYLDEYIQLFINFKLKVTEAKELGMDTNLSFINELEGYRQQLAKPYLRNKEFDRKLLIESYNRMQKDINVSHILISFDENTTDLEKKIKYNKLIKTRDAILNNEISFSDAAKKVSDDESAILNAGNLGYFTAFMMVYDFETAAYSTPTGAISMPIKTKYGYHLIKVNNVRDAVGKVEVAHIMFKTGKGAGQEQISESYKKIVKALNLVNNGEAFESVAERFSEDRSTAVKGGLLPVFGVGKMVASFDSIAFSLKNKNDISEPFLSEFGWHAVKLINRYPIAKLSEIESEIKIMIEKDSRNLLTKKALYEKLKGKYKVKNNVTEFKKFRKKFFSKVSNGMFNEIDNNSPLLYIDNNTISVNEFSKYIVKNQFKGSNIDDLYLEFVNDNLLRKEESLLEDSYPEYKALLKEYREGILLFDLTNKKVWKKAVEDTISLKKFFLSNINAYKWSKRVDATIYRCNNLKTAKEVRKHIYKKNRGLLNDDDILKRINDDNPLRLTIVSKKFEKNDNEFIDNIDWDIGISKDVILNDGTYILIDIKEVIPICNKELFECRGKVISDFQNYLELKWLENLKLKYSISINYELLYSLIK